MTGYDTTADYDTTAQEAALRLIALRCRELAGDAAKALGITSPAARQARLDRLIPQALEHPTVTGEDRRVLLDALWPAPGPNPGTMTKTMRFRVTVDQQIRIEDAARAAGQTPSDYIRAKLLGDTP